MIKSALIGLLVITLFGCSEDAEVKTDMGKVESNTKEVKVNANRLLTMEIDGMVCQMGCGGSIRKELKATGAVSGVEFDFEDDRETNIAKISFDKNSITVDELIKVVSEINDGQFKIGKTSSEEVYSAHFQTETGISSEAKSEVEVSSSSIEIPNLLELLSGLLLN